jgi:hypothetical protein
MSLAKFQLRRDFGDKKDVVLVDPGHVGAIFPHSTYTTLLVDGEYVQVDHDQSYVIGQLQIRRRMA